MDYNKKDDSAVREEQEKIDKARAERQSMTGSDPTGEREEYKDNPRPPKPHPTGPSGTFPNVPKEGYKQNPSNASQDLPPERQAPRPADPKEIGTGASHTTEPDKKA